MKNVDEKIKDRGEKTLIGCYDSVKKSVDDHPDQLTYKVPNPYGFVEYLRTVTRVVNHKMNDGDV